MSNKADKCPKCGAPAKKKTTLFTLIIAGFFGLVIISALSSKSSSTPSTPSTPSASSPDGPVTHNQTKAAWSYDNSTDKVSGKETKDAITISNNSFEMGFPYQGGTTGRIIIRKHPRYGKDIIFSGLRERVWVKIMFFRVSGA
jgi:hypothetical protein